MLLKIRVVARLGLCVADRANCQGLLLLELCRGRRPLGVVRRVVRRSESGCGDVGGEHRARVPRDAGATFAQRVFFAGRFYEPMNLLTARPRPDDSPPDSTDDAPPPLHTHTARTRPPPQRPPKAPRPPPAAPPPRPATQPRLLNLTSKLSLRVYLARLPRRV